MEIDEPAGLQLRDRNGEELISAGQAAVDRRIDQSAVILTRPSARACFQPDVDWLPPRCQWTVIVNLSFLTGRWTLLLLCFCLHLCSISALCVYGCEFKILRSTHICCWECVLRRTGGLSVCLSLPVELLFDQGERNNSPSVPSSYRQSCQPMSRVRAVTVRCFPELTSHM